MRKAQTEKKLKFVSTESCPTTASQWTTLIGQRGKLGKGTTPHGSFVSVTCSARDIVPSQVSCCSRLNRLSTWPFLAAEICQPARSRSPLLTSDGTRSTVERDLAQILRHADPTRLCPLSAWKLLSGYNV